jgi:hypothetical protein
LGDRRLIVVERVDDVLHTIGTRAMHPGDSVTLGRAAELPIGHTNDARISRLALTVECTDAGWAIESTNRNGVLLHPWGLAPRYAQRNETTDIPRMALRIVGSIVREHWVLLEDDTRLHAGRYRSDDSNGPTPAELEALRRLFPDLLEWPPTLAEWPPGIEQVASELHITTDTLMRQLEGIRARAVSLGLSPDVTVADPDYVHLLVQAGWLRPDQFPTQ